MTAANPARDAEVPLIRIVDDDPNLRDALLFMLLRARGCLRIRGSCRTRGAAACDPDDM